VGKVKRWNEDGPDEWRQVQEYTTFERDVPLASGLFLTEPPATGYVIEKSREEATIPVRRNWLEVDIYEDTQFGYAPLNYRVWPAFLLPDGSILVGYQSVDAKESREQSRYFKGLEPGGPPAKLPVEVYALSPEPNTRNVSFVGFYLAHTEEDTDRGRRWFEWILYVPDGPPPGSDAVLIYRLQYRLNVERAEDTEIRMKQIAVRGLVTIAGVEDFNRLVLTAVAERSDGGVVPSQVTYENVLRLTEQLRTAVAR
jgi:hypothetical protein